MRINFPDGTWVIVRTKAELDAALATKAVAA